MTEDQASTLELRDYLRVLWRHKWIILVSVVVCVGVALAMSLSRAPVYATSANVLTDQRFVNEIFNPLNQRNNALDADRRRANEIEIMKSPRVREQVQEQLGRPPDRVNFNPVAGTDVIEISSRGGEPKDIAETANAFAQEYLDVREELTVSQLQEVIDQLDTQIAKAETEINYIDGDLVANPPSPPNRDGSPTDSRVIARNTLSSRVSQYRSQQQQMELGISVAQSSGAQILAAAPVRTEPVNKSSWTDILAGLAIGLVLGIALAFLREYLDDSVKTKDDLEQATGLTVVGIVPALTEWKKRETVPLISMLQPRSPAAEAYRSVRTSVEFLSLDHPIGSLAVTSALAGDGKTSTVANLAVTFARAGQRVIIVCCDLRRPRIHEFFGVSNRVGFTSVLLGDAPIATAIQSVDRELPIGLLASGPLPPNPAELLTSKRAVDVIEELDQRCDLLLIDSPPVLPVSDALVISGLVDGVLLVASAGHSTKRGMRRAIEILRQVDAPLIGSVLNNVQSKHEYSYVYGDNRYYLDQPQPSGKGSGEARKDKGKGKESRNGKGRSRVSVRPDR